MDGLSQQEIAVLTIQLETKEAHLHTQIDAATVTATTFVAREPGDDSELTEQAMLQRQTDALLEHYRAEMADIAAARERIRLGQYGMCIDCGEPVPFSRMLAYPTAKRCAACQRDHEHRQGRAPAKGA